MVNTFLPYSDFQKCAEVLDRLRLGKQRVEAKQIIDTIEQNRKAWRNHPAVNMWRGYTDALKLYFNTIVKEWIKRGYKNNMLIYENLPEQVEMPWWMGNTDFHYSHQASLARKNGQFYGDKFVFPDEY